MHPQIIPGIHNYCDRWCEKCQFTKRCAVFLDMENEDDAKSTADTKQEFFDRLMYNFQKIQGLLEEAVKVHGIDISDITRDMDKVKSQEIDIEMRSVDHPLGKLSDEYRLLTRDWLEVQPGMLDKLEQLKSDLSLTSEIQLQAKDQLQQIQESLEVIEWYHAFIHLKLMRSLKGRMTFEDQTLLETYPQDYNGSAKLAILAIDRSIHAWAILFHLLPEQEDHFLKVLAFLQRLRKLVEIEFPEAMAFHRPGFDDNEES